MALQTEQGAVIDAQSPTLSDKRPTCEDNAPAFAFPPMDYERFKWRPSPQDPKLHTREVVGSEIYEELWARLNHGEFTIFYGVDVKRTDTSVPNSTLIEKARAAWAQLRYSVPTLASQIDYDYEGKALLTYRVADSAKEVDDWVSKTFIVEEGVSDLNEFRYTLGQTPIPTSRGCQVYLHFIPREDSFGLLLQTHHSIFDGAGVKVLTTKYLKMLVASLTGEVDVKLVWGDEAKNLEPAVISALADDQALEGPVYQQTLGEILTDLATNQPRAHGYKDGRIASGNSRRKYYKFSAGESSALLRGSKSKGFTINQIAHAALSMVTAEDSPTTADTPSEASLLYFNLVNSRDRLVEPFRSAGYTSVCLAMHPVLVPMSSFNSVSNFADLSVLMNTAGLIKRQYGWAKSSPALIGVIAQASELTFKPLVLAAAQAEKSEVKISVPPNFGPWFSGDGVVETYFPNHFVDSSGKSVFDIQDVFISLNIVDPRPFFRVFTFKNEIILSVDHNESALPPDTVDRLFGRWTEFIRLVLQ